MPDQTQNKGRFIKGVSGNPKGRPRSGTPVTLTSTRDHAFVNWGHLELVALDEVTQPETPRVYKSRLAQAAEYREQQLAVNPCCEICEVEFELTLSAGKGQRGACVDHDHVTGEIRGLICQGCNKALGFIKDRAETAERMALYLRKQR